MSDIADRNIVMFIFFFTFVYINLLRIRINFKNDWENMKCNPMSLWSNSMFGDEKIATQHFNQCINTLSSEAITRELDSAYAQQTSAMDAVTAQERVLREYQGTVSTEIQGTNVKIDANLVKIEDIKDKQIQNQNINEILTTKNTDDNTLYKFTSTINTIFNNIKEYLPTIR